MKNTLEIDSVILEYGLRRILQSVYVKSDTGKVTGLLGLNGSGKSSLMKIIFGEINPHSKSIRLNEKAILGTYRDPRDIRYLPQCHFIPKRLKVKEVFRDMDLDFDEFIMWFSNFEEYQNMKMESLSGGLRRIVEIYFILVSDTKFCLLDEPFSQVMPIHVEVLKKLILKEKETKGIILTDRMYKHILEISDDLYVISDGKTHLTKSIMDLQTLGYARIE